MTISCLWATGWDLKQIPTLHFKMEGGRTDKRTDGRKDLPCLLQDFVPSASLPGQCPKGLGSGRIKNQKARDGLRYPCLVEGSLLCKNGCGPKEGQSPVEYRGNLFVHTSSPGNLLWGLGQTGPLRGWLKPPNGQLRPLKG